MRDDQNIICADSFWTYLGCFKLSIFYQELGPKMFYMHHMLKKQGGNWQTQVQLVVLVWSRLVRTIWFEMKSPVSQSVKVTWLVISLLAEDKIMKTYFHFVYFSLLPPSMWCQGDIQQYTEIPSSEDRDNFDSFPLLERTVREADWCEVRDGNTPSLKCLYSRRCLSFNLNVYKSE